MSDQPKYLKSLKSGRKFLWTELLAKRGDLVPCDVDGKLLGGVSGEVNLADTVTDRRKTPYLGSLSNGVLYKWTDILAERQDMVSVDTPEMWEAMRKEGKAPDQAPNTVAPKLNRQTPVERFVKQDPTDMRTLPVIEGMGPREAKSMLAEWAHTHYGQSIDRRPSLESVISTCQALIDADQEKAAEV